VPQIWLKIGQKYLTFHVKT